MRKPLTAKGLQSLKPKDKPYYVPDVKQDGLRVRVAPTGTLSWSTVYRIRGKGVKSISLGRCDPSGKNGLDLAGARDRAAALIKAAREGHDLIAEEQKAAAAEADTMTINDLIDAYAKSIASPHRSGGPLRTAKEITARLYRALDGKLTEPAHSLRRADISRLLDAVVDRYPREAEKRRQQIGAMYKWGVAKGYVEHNPVDGTPTYGRGEPCDRVLDDEEIVKLWGWLEAGANQMPPDVISVLRLQLLTGARCGEVAGMCVNEFHMNDGLMIWTLPPERSKNKKERTTPIVGLARELIEAAMKERPKGSLFRTLNTNRTLAASDVGAALGKRKTKYPINEFSSHDLRRTVVSGMDGLGLSLDTIAAVVGHQRGTAATRVLVRHYARNRELIDPRVVAALTAWDAHITAIVEGQEAEADNIIRLPV